MSKHVSSQNSTLPAGASTSKQIRTGTMMTLYRMRNSITMSHFILIGAVGASMHLPLVGSSSSSRGTAEKVASFCEVCRSNLRDVLSLLRGLLDGAESGTVFTPFTVCATTNGGVAGDRRPLLGVLAPDGLLSVGSFWAELGLLLPGLLPAGLYGLFLAVVPLRALPPAWGRAAPALMHCWRIMVCRATW